MHLLLCTTKDQAPHLKRFATLGVLHGHNVSVMFETPLTFSEIKLKCERATPPIDGIMIANPAILKLALYALPDFREPQNRKELTLDDYQGSFFEVRGIPCVVLNPPEHIMTVSYGAFIFSRFISKLTKPKEWFTPTPFSWELANESTIDSLYQRLSTSRIIAIDIETPNPDTPEHTINCVSYTGYFPDTHSSISIVLPFNSLFWLTWHRKLCALPIPKVMQGGSYDAVRLLRFNCPVLYYFFDTLALFHSYLSELPKRLDFITAYAVRESRFWKNDGKTGNLEDYYRYNGLDGWATLNSLLSLLLEIPDYVTTNYVEQFPLYFPAIQCDIEGWRVDPVRFKEAAATQQKIASDRLAAVRTMLGAPNYNPGSWQQNQKVFKILGCADIGETTRGPDGRLVFKQTTGEASMKKAEFRHPLNARVIGGIRDYKKSSKLVSTYFDEEKLWKFSDTHWRLFYRINPFGTDTGRCASTESAWWGGFQIQNIKRGPIVKQCLISDSGWELAEPDFEQSESRCTFYLAGDEVGIAVVESSKDFHCWNAQLFFGFKYEELWDEKTKQCKTPEAKYIRDEPAKRTNHGANYCMTEGTMLNTMGPKAVSKVKAVLLKQKVISPTLTLKQVCGYCLEQFHKTYKALRGNYYPYVKKQLELTKKLVSPLGWVRHCFGDITNKHHFNSYVAHGPQNLSVGIINRGFYEIWREGIYGKLRGHFRIKAQVHDSLPYQYRRGSEWVNDEVKRIMRKEVPVTGADGKRRTLVIPVGMKSGAERWSEIK